MEYLNRIELRGVVGNVKVTPERDSAIARISLMTAIAYKDSYGMPVIQSCWHNLVVFSGKGIPADTVKAIEKGDRLYIEGILHQQRYTNDVGTTSSYYEVLVNKLSVLDKNQPINYQI